MNNDISIQYHQYQYIPWNVVNILFCFHTSKPFCFYTSNRLNLWFFCFPLYYTLSNAFPVRQTISPIPLLCGCCGRRCRRCDECSEGGAVCFLSAVHHVCKIHLFGCWLGWIRRIFISIVSLLFHSPFTLSRDEATAMKKHQKEHLYLRSWWPLRWGIGTSS